MELLLKGLLIILFAMMAVLVSTAVWYGVFREKEPIPSWVTEPCEPTGKEKPGLIMVKPILYGINYECKTQDGRILWRSKFSK